MWYIYRMEYYSAIKENEIMPFPATWWSWRLSYLIKSVRERQIYDLAYMQNLNNIQKCLFTKQKHSYRI